MKRLCIVCDRPMRVKKGRGSAARRMHKKCRKLYMQRKAKEHYERQKSKPPKKVGQLRASKNPILLAHLPVGGKFEREVYKILNSERR